MRVLTRLMLAAVALGALAAAQGQSRPDLQLKAAVYKETVEGDLKGAADLYKQVASNADAPRQVAAAALLGLGGCYEKLGQQDARKVYERLVAEFSDQAREVAEARQRLAALSGGAPARTRDSRLTIRRVPDLDMFAKPSPDGKFLAFTDWDSGNLAVRDVVTGATRALTKDGVLGGGKNQYAMFSSWSRDSRRLAYQWYVDDATGSRSEFRVISLNSNAPPETITVAGARWVGPRDWSPDGSRILCSYGQSTGVSGVALVGIGNSAVEKLDVPVGGWLEYQFVTEGDAILYSASADGKPGPSDIFLRNLKTGTTTPIVQHPAEDLLVGVLPGSDWLFFASDRRGGLDLWAVPFRQGAAAGQPVSVKQGLGRLFPLGFTSDGRYYYATLSATDDVFLADFNPGTGRVTSEARKFTSRWDGVSAFPSYSPDGASLAYVVKRGPAPLPVHVADSLVVQSLTSPTADPAVVGFSEFDLEQVIGPCWLADGSAVVLGGYANQSRDLGLYRVDLPGLRKEKIFPVDGGPRMIAHECASDRPAIYVQVTTPASGEGAQPLAQIVRIDASGGNEREVFRAPLGQGIGSFALSPDGRMLSIIARLDRNRRALLVMPAEGGTPRQVHEFREPSGGGGAQTWSPDGRSILFVQMSDTWKEDRTFLLWSVRADGGPAEPKTIFSWTGQFFGLRFHPNGRVLAFSGRPSVSTSSEVWVIENLKEELKLLPPSRPKHP
jgi:Tol biopolymer transport system component